MTRAVRDIFLYRDLIWELVIRALKVRYRRSTVGFMWTMLHPLIMMLVWTLVFSRAFQFNAEHYAVYALSGITFWQFFSQTITSNLHSLLGNARLLTKLPVPKMVFPVATVLSGLLNLLFSLVPLLAIAAVSGSRPTFALLLLPIAIVLAGLFALGAGLLLAPLAVLFIDTIEIVTILLSLLMYLTPVFYPRSIVPANWQPLFRLNPITALLEVFRAPLVTGGMPAGSDLAIALVSSVGLFALGAWVFRTTSRRVAIYL